MEKLEIIEMFVKIDGELVGVKFRKVIVAEAGVRPYYEYRMQKFFQMKGDMEPKQSGETFCAEDFNILMFRLIGYVNELNHVGIEKSIVNENY